MLLGYPEPATEAAHMLFSKRPNSIEPLLYDEDDTKNLLLEMQKRGTGDTTSNLLLIFSVADIIEFKQDTHRLVRRLSTLCGLLTHVVVALVGLWLLRTLVQ
jgi:hypothetical protein